MADVPTHSRAARIPDSRPLVTLGIGRVLTAKQPHRVRTVLGSCVAVILYIPRLRVSSLCHAQSPEPRHDSHCADSCPRLCRAHVPATNEYRYVTCCLTAMLADVTRLGARLDEMVATVVGGANVVKEIQATHSVANDNVRLALDMLGRKGIRIARTDVGGTRGRTILYHTDTNQLDIRLHPQAP